MYHHHLSPPQVIYKGDQGCLHTESWSEIQLKKPLNNRLFPGFSAAARQTLLKIQKNSFGNGCKIRNPDGLSSKDQVEARFRNAFAPLWDVCPLRLLLDWGRLLMLTHAFVTSCLEYCNVLYIGWSLKSWWSVVIA